MLTQAQKDEGWVELTERKNPLPRYKKDEFMVMFSDGTVMVSEEEVPA